MHTPKQQTQHLSQTLKATKCGIWDWHISEDRVFFSPNYYRIYGYEPDEFRHKLESWEKRVHPDDIDPAKRAIQQYLAGELEHFSIEFRFKTKAGNWIWTLRQGEITERDETGNPTRFVGFDVDISQRDNTEQVFQEERAFSKSLINTAQMIVLILDVGGRIRLINPYMEEMTGYKEAEVKGQDWFDTFLPPADHTEIRAAFKKAVDGIVITRQVNTIVAKDGRRLTIEWHNKILENVDDHIAGVLCLGIDVTDRKNAEERLAHQKKLLEKAQELGQIGSWEYNSDQKIFVGTEVGNQIYGIPNGFKAKYEMLLRRIHPEDKDFFHQNWETALKRGTFDIEHRIIVNNSVKWVREKAEMDFDDNGEVVGGIGFTQDITERKIAEDNRRAGPKNLNRGISG